ncbi:MAG: glutamine-hydrolyzing carbamoyl-phosphate synthase small subunit [Thermoprotei archaeon]|nr:glutamine-hydrolyzing carbamoyl-phosphate synthase small subunit [Thermoprotei archaeon]
MTHIPMRNSKCQTRLKARLLTADGLAVEGCGFGSPGVRVGELVFSTSMTGYTEALTDPSYAGQILVWTHPMVGCYGVPSPEHSYCGVPFSYESERVHVEGFIVSELPPHNHYLSVAPLSEWLRSSGVPGMYRVDTRFIVKRIREIGAVMSVLAVYPEGEVVEWERLREELLKSRGYDYMSFAERVSPGKVLVHEPEGAPEAEVAVLDCGLKNGILRWLLKFKFKVVRFPCWSKPGELLEGFDGIILSNGPGNPEMLKDQVKTVEELLYSGKPVLGICLGMQLASLALGARVYKLKYGHRGPNKGVLEVGSGKSYITTQNHGYAVYVGSLEGSGLKPWFINVDDGTLEGLRHEKLKVILTQFHPEGGPGPHDTTWVFKLYKSMVLRDGGP